MNAPYFKRVAATMVACLALLAGLTGCGRPDDNVISAEITGRGFFDPVKYDNNTWTAQYGHCRVTIVVNDKGVLTLRQDSSRENNEAFEWAWPNAAGLASRDYETFGACEYTAPTTPPPLTEA